MKKTLERYEQSELVEYWNHPTAEAWVEERELDGNLLYFTVDTVGTLREYDTDESAFNALGDEYGYSDLWEKYGYSDLWEKEDPNTKKYILTDNTIQHEGITLYQIKALRSFGKVVKEGDLGGWIAREKNLSHEGDCWVFGNAQVYDNARVLGDARVYGYAEVSGDAWVLGDAKVYGGALVYGNARVSGDAQVHGNAMVYGNAKVSGNAKVYGEDKISGDTAVNL